MTFSFMMLGNGVKISLTNNQCPPCSGVNIGPPSWKSSPCHGQSFAHSLGSCIPFVVVVVGGVWCSLEVLGQRCRTRAGSLPALPEEQCSSLMLLESLLVYSCSVGMHCQASCLDPF